MALLGSESCTDTPNPAISLFAIQKDPSRCPPTPPRAPPGGARSSPSPRRPPPLAAFTVPATAATAHNHSDGAYTITINGSNASPESIAADNHFIYTGSIDDGTVYRGRVGAKTLEPFLPGGQDGRTEVTGVKITGNRLLFAGAFTGRFFIYTSAGRLVSSYTVPDPGEKTLVNDEAACGCTSGSR